MNKAYIRSFKGLSYDKCPFNIEENASTLCQDVISTPKGALSSPWGSTKWNETSLGFINGLYDYRNRRGGQYIIDFYSTSGAGFGKTDYSEPPSSGGSTPTQTPDSSGNIDSSTYSTPPLPAYYADISITDPIYDYGANYQLWTRYDGTSPPVGYVYYYVPFTINVTVKKSTGGTATDYQSATMGKAKISSAYQMTTTKIEANYWFNNKYVLCDIVNGVGSVNVYLNTNDDTGTGPLYFSDQTFKFTTVDEGGLYLTPTQSSNYTTRYVYVSSFPNTSGIPTNVSCQVSTSLGACTDCDGEMLSDSNKGVHSSVFTTGETYMIRISIIDGVGSNTGGYDGYGPESWDKQFGVYYSDGSPVVYTAIVPVP